MFDYRRGINQKWQFFDMFADIGTMETRIPHGNQTWE